MLRGKDGLRVGADSLWLRFKAPTWMRLPAGWVEVEEKKAPRAESWGLRGQGGSSR